MLIESFSGIRGIYDKDLDKDTAIRYAFCYSEFIKKRNKTPLIVIGTDTRPSKEPLKEAVIEGLDCDIIDIGIATTPAAEFAVRYLKADGGVIITASHNEPKWNGFKLLDKDGAVLRPKDIQNIINRYTEIKKVDKITFFKDYLSDNKIKVKKIIKKNITKDYSGFLSKIIGKDNINLIKNSKQKIIIDPNGGTAVIAKEILEKTGVDVISVNDEIGKFSREIEPNEKSLSPLKKLIEEKNAGFAAGFDCDGDRLQIMTKDGLISGHYILAIIADDILKNEKDIVVTNDATSGIVKEIIKNHKAKLLEVEVGEINVVDEMENNNAIVGGEGSSGGVILPPSKCRDGILTLLNILSIIAKKQKSLQEIIKTYPKYHTLTEKIKFKPKDHDKIKNKIKEHYLKKGYDIQETGDIKGGLKILIDETTFIWFRASKTEENILRLMADSKEEEKSKKIIKEAKKLIQQ